MQSRNQRHWKDSTQAWLALACTALMAVMVSADSLQGVGLRGFDTFRGRKHLSMMGGAKLMTKADGGLDPETGANYMQYMNYQVDPEGLTSIKQLSRDDQFYSNPDSGKIAFTTPSVLELFNAPDLAAFNDADGGLPSRVVMSASVKSGETPEGTIHCQNEAECVLEYQRKYTPLLADIVPNQMYKGQPVDWYINAQGVMAEDVTPPGRLPMEELSFDGVLNNWEETIDENTRLKDWRTSHLRAIVGDQKPNRNSEPRARFITGDTEIRKSQQHCNFAGDECWKVRTHAKIDSISANSGNTVGGQELTISGWGFEHGADITVAGVPCEVVSATMEEVKCITGPSGPSVDNVNQPGQPGIARRQYEKDGGETQVYFSELQQSPIVLPMTEESLELVFEHPTDYKEKASQVFDGFFKAPATGEYRFYLDCHNSCKLRLDSTTPLSMNAPFNPVVIADQIKSTWRDYLQPPHIDDISKHQSDWIQLKAGEYYKIDALHIQAYGERRLTASVEFKASNQSAHPMSKKETQVLTIDQDNQPETWEVIITNPSNGAFRLVFQHPQTLQMIQTGNLSAEMSDGVFNKEIYIAYYKDHIGSICWTTKTYYDESGIETQNFSMAKTVKFKVHVGKRSVTSSFASINLLVDPANTSTITIVKPTEVGGSPSSAPLSGNFRVNCPDPLNPSAVAVTDDISFNYWNIGIQGMIEASMPFLRDRIRVIDMNVYGQRYRENARKLAIVFEGMDIDMPQCYLTSGVEEPISGSNPRFEAETLNEFGENLFFQPIPLEMLYTAATRPQVLVNVDGMPAACANLNCDYMYEETDALITSQAINGNTLTITGANLPTSLIDVRLGDVGCGPTTGTANQITCTLPVRPTAGTYAKVEVQSAAGLVPVDEAVPPLAVTLVGISVFPTTNLSHAGGDELTITGMGLPQTTDQIDVTFSDGTKCKVTSSSASEAKCISKGFDRNQIDTLNPYTMNINVNGENDNSAQLMLIPVPMEKVMSVQPTSVSPVLKQDLTINLHPHFPDISAILGDYRAFIEGQDEYERELNIVSYDDVTKTLKVKFNGAPSDDYVITVRGPNGNVDGPVLTLTTVIAVDSISPTQGSVLGGTLLTITGEHYGTQATDNPVKVGDNYCLIESTSANEIKCRIAISKPTVVSSAEVIVFAKTYEESECRINGGLGCVFDYQASTTSVFGISASFDSQTNSIIAVVTGMGFDAGDTVGTELWIDGMKQETLQVQAVMAVFRLTSVKSTSSSDIKFYTAEGTPEGSLDSLSWDAGLLSISPSVGSSGGTLLTVTGVGFGIDDTVNLYHMASAQEICSSVEVTGYGTFTCQTIAQTISTSDELRIVVDASQYSCVNWNTPSDCELKQEKASSPTLSSVAMNGGDSINFSGSNFPTTGHDVTCMYEGVTGTVSRSRTTTATCTFSSGVPAGNAAIASLIFKNRADGSELTSDADGQTLTNALSIGAGQSGLSCSFAGGCMYTVQGNGIAGAIQSNENNSIKVCGNECKLDLTESSGSQATCILPPLATSHSANEYDIALSKELEVTWTGTGLDLSQLNNGVNTRDSEDNSSSNCYAQVTARDGFTYSIDQVKVFLNNLLDKSPYTGGNLKIQGSNNGGASFTDIYSYDELIHEGWNTFDSRASPQVFSTIRLQGAVAGSCRLGQVKLIGVEVLNNSNTSASCTAKLTIDGSTTTLTDVTYSGAITPSLTEVTGIMPRYGSVLGGESVTFSGSGFSGDATVFIDDRPCAVTARTSTEITCTTADKPYVPGEPTLRIYIDGVGDVATRGLVYRYVSRWSDKETWGNDIPPLEGEAVEIPSGQHLLVDVQRVPKLEFVLVYGSLIFESNENDANDHKFFDAGYIMVNGGYMEIGTEAFPYTSKLTITMHGDKSSPYLPIYGNKVVAVRFGQLEMHGKPRSHVWTDMDTTAEAGATSITLSDVGGIELDWQVGEKIAIASTDYDGTHSEVKTITGVTNRTTKPVIQFDGQPLEYKHFADEVTVGSDSIVMRAEVGLLSRNVVYRGDPETSLTNQYGAQIMLHSPGDESVVGRIENCEFKDVGQAFMLGRYPIHFHMIGNVQKSWIRKNSIHQTYNRGTTLHGVHYLEVSGNFYYKAMGHTVFIEDAIETKNLIVDNLVMDTRESNSLFNTDQTPACFWITHPDNIFRGNHCAGSKRYGAWFDLQDSATGPSFDTNVCPKYSKLGEFSDNVMHSCGRYGLRIHHELVPRQNPCLPFVADMSNPSDPYWQNQVIPAKFERVTAYKNGRNGVIAERVGAIEFHDFKTADNLLAGIEVSLSEDVIDGYAKIVDAVVIGKTSNTDSELEEASPHGIITPRTENFTIDGAHFYNYDFNDAAALGDCSHCFHSASTDSGARTYTTKRLEFTDTPRRIRYQYPARGIFHDMDGSLTGKGANTYATKGYPHVQQPECATDAASMDMYDGVVCDPSVEIRRITFLGYSPDYFMGQEINIYPYDKVSVDTRSEEANDAFLADTSNSSQIVFKKKEKPSDAWAVPYVTGHRYRVTWANDLDFTQMKIQASERQEQDDKDVIFVIPFVDAREAINVTRTDTNEQIMDKTMLEATSSWITGTNWLQSDTDIREFQVVVNGKDSSIQEIHLQGLRCIHGDCPEDYVKPVPLGDAKYWSDSATWPSGQLPQAGEDVHIEPGMNVILDIETPQLNLLIINGKLSFFDGNDPIHLHAKQIYVRAGTLEIGTEASPYQGSAQITLYGSRHEQTLMMVGSVVTGNKVIYNTGTVSMHGKTRSRNSRLRASVYKDSSIAFVEPMLDWMPGDQIYFAPTNHQWTHSEYKKIVSYEAGSGMITLDSPFEFYHYGEDSSTAGNYNGVDTRGEVRLLSRNIKVVGQDEGEKWGCTFLTNDRMEFDGTIRKGTTQLDYVEVAQCAQENTWNAAIRFESTGETGNNWIKNTVVHSSYQWSLLIDSSKDIVIENSDFIGSMSVGLNLKSISNVSMDGLFIGDVQKREWTALDSIIDKVACVAYCSYWNGDRCFDNSLTNSIAAGCPYAGFVAPGHACDDNDSTIFRDNVAHSGERVGALIYPNPAISSSSSCYKGSHFSAYKNRDGGLSTMYDTAHLLMHDMTFIDNASGVCLQTGGERERIIIEMQDVEIYGEDNNSDVPDGQERFCVDKYGLMLFGANQKVKELHPTKGSSLPIYKVKSYGAWGPEITLTRVNFNNFQNADTRKCGKKHSAIQRNPSSSDYIPVHLFQNTKFTDVNDQAVAYIRDPHPAWAQQDQCMEWPCTAPENVVLKFEDTTYGGSIRPLKTIPSFQIVSDVEDAVRGYSGCEMKPAWSAAWCDNRNLGLLLFESLDSDSEDRSIQPVHLTNEVTNYHNKVNSMMDHIWDGFYTGQKRLSRFPIQVEALGDYTLDFTGTPASSMRFVLKADVGGMQVKIPYRNAGSYTVFANGVEKPYTKWDKTIGRSAELSKTEGCGENRYVGVENFLEFYITPDCEIKIVPRDSIMVSVRLDWTLEEFYDANGIDNFTDRMAAVLGVHASQIKVVAVYEGSVVVEFLVETDPEDEEPEKTLNEVQLDFYDAVVNDKIDLGAPIIDAMANDRIVKTNYDGNHYQGKDGNIWDHLLDNNNSGSSADGNTGSGKSGSTDQSGSSSDSNSQDTQEEEEKLISKVTDVRIVTEEEAAMTDTVKYLIVFLAVLSVALVFVIGYIAMRMCSKRRMKPVNFARRAAQASNQIHAGNDAKVIVRQNSMRRKKSNDVDEKGEASLDVNHVGTHDNLNIQQTPIHNDMLTEEQNVETERGLTTTSHK